MGSLSLGQLALFGFLLCLHALSSRATASIRTSSCPTIEAALASCPINRTAMLTELYANLAAPGDPTGCAPKSAIQRAYLMLVPLPERIDYGSRFDDLVFINCDLLRDNRFCPLDIANTVCECASHCNLLETIESMVYAMRDYPNWTTTGVPWNYGFVL
jgi:hypothetical protein